MAVNRDDFKQLLRDNNLKVTKQRLLVLEAIASSEQEHLTAEEIYDLVKADCPEIGLATIYRTIQLLNELQLINRINFDDGFARYEMGNTHSEEQRHRHHHLICKKCGKVTSFQDDLLEELESAVMKQTGFFVVDHEVKFYGYCVECGGDLIEKKRE